MKKNLVTFAVAAALLVPAMAFADDSSSVTKNGPILYGYAQITGSQQFATSTNGVSSSAAGGNGLVFGANRIRLGVKGQAVEGVTYNIMAGWDNAVIGGNNAGNASINGFSTNQLNNGLGNGGNASILDAWLNYAPVPWAQLEVGKFKMPVGNEYVDVQGNELPFIFRSMSQALLPGRGAGVMLHANNVMGTGFGYALALADATSLDYGSAYNWSLGSVSNPFGSGQGGFLNGSGQYLLSGRLTYSMGPLVKAEASAAQMTTPRNTQYESLFTWNVGVHGGLMGINYAAGYTDLHTGTTRTGFPGYHAQDWNVALGANLHEMGFTPSWLDIEPAVRFDQYSYNGYGSAIYGGNGQVATLNNTTVGLNYYVNPNDPHAAQIQVNYIIPTNGKGQFGTNGTANPQTFFGGNGAPINGMAYNTLMLQFQAGF